MSAVVLGPRRFPLDLPLPWTGTVFCYDGDICQKQQIEWLKDGVEEMRPWFDLLRHEATQFTAEAKRWPEGSEGRKAAQKATYAVLKANWKEAVNCGYKTAEEFWSTFAAQRISLAGDDGFWGVEQTKGRDDPTRYWGIIVGVLKKFERHGQVKRLRFKVMIEYQVTAALEGEKLSPVFVPQDGDYQGQMDGQGGDHFSVGPPNGGGVSMIVNPGSGHGGYYHHGNGGGNNYGLSLSISNTTIPPAPSDQQSNEVTSHLPEITLAVHGPVLSTGDKAVPGEAGGAGHHDPKASNDVSSFAPEITLAGSGLLADDHGAPGVGVASREAGGTSHHDHQASNEVTSFVPGHEVTMTLAGPVIYSDPSAASGGGTSCHGSYGAGLGGTSMFDLPVGGWGSGVVM